MLTVIASRAPCASRSAFRAPISMSRRKRSATAMVAPGGVWVARMAISSPPYRAVREGFGTHRARLASLALYRGSAACMAARPASISRRLEEKSALPAPASRGRTTTSAPRNSALLMLFPMMANDCNNTCKGPSVVFACTMLEMSTATTSSAPISRART